MAKGSSAPSLSARRDRGAQHISDIVVGMGERGRREAIEDAQKRKVKSGFTNSLALMDKKYTFVVSVAHYSYRPAGWKKSSQHWSHTESNRQLTSNQLTISLLEGLKAKGVTIRI
jgi:hypothetical protein